MKKYLEIYDVISKKIDSGELPPGAQLPTESATAAEYGVSRQTVRQAFDLLRQQGCIFSIQGSGSFVSTAKKPPHDSHRIAVIITYFSEYIFPSILRGISEAAVENGYSVEISTTNNSISAERKILQALLEKPAAGIIVEGTKAALPNPNTRFYRELSARGVPIVFINSIYPGLESERIVSVVTADYDGGYQLARELFARGHADIGCIFKSDDAQSLNRFAGVMAAFADCGVEFDDTNFYWYSTETRNSLFSSLASSPMFTRCSAIICYNDLIVSELVSYLKRRPHTIEAIAGFDNNINPDLIPPEIDFTSLSHPRDKLGKIAAQKLFNLLSGRQETSAVLPWTNDPIR